MSYKKINDFFSNNINLSDINILCIGDVILDTFFECEANRISSENPVPVMIIKSQLDVLGGNGNVANNISSFGAKVTCVGAVGTDKSGDSIKKICEQKDINFVEIKNEGTIVKQRYFANKHSVFRSDYEFFCNDNNFIIEYVEQNIKKFNAIVLSNYNYGLITESVAKSVIQIANKHRIPVFVDPNKAKNLDFFRSCFLFKPNLSEFEKIIDKKLINIEEIAIEAQKIIKEYSIENILITMSENGQLLIDKNKYIHIPNLLQSDVIDVTGAGDTVISTIATIFCKTNDLILSANLANLAANIVVKHFGTSQTNLLEMQHYYNKEKSELINQSKEYIQKTVQYLQSQNKIVGLANGCFDILHEGHIKLLNNAKKMCDYLIVAVNSDKSVKILKGDSRPFNNEFSRIVVLSNIISIDSTVLFDETSPIDLILFLKPNIVFKGKDYNTKTLPEYDKIVAYGGRVEFLDLLDGFSTTGVLNKMKQ
jgi:D-beta-D-heptose 7-phosphate kinase/D-beta-D-heptose 1-phosphate adenosyltransferase